MSIKIITPSGVLRYTEILQDGKVIGLDISATGPLSITVNPVAMKQKHLADFMGDPRDHVEIKTGTSVLIQNAGYATTDPDQYSGPIFDARRPDPDKPDTSGSNA